MRKSEEQNRKSRNLIQISANKLKRMGIVGRNNDKTDSFAGFHRKIIKIRLWP